MKRSEQCHVLVVPMRRAILQEVACGGLEGEADGREEGHAEGAEFVRSEARKDLGPREARPR